MQLIYKIFLSIFILLNLSGYALSRISTFWDDSGDDTGGFLSLFILFLVFFGLFMWDKYKESRPDKYNRWTGEKYYQKPKKKKSLSDKFVKTFNIQTLDVKKVKKKKNKKSKI